VVAAAWLAGRDGPISHVDVLPGMPTGVLLTAQSTSRQAEVPSTTPTSAYRVTTRPTHVAAGHPEPPTERRAPEPVDHTAPTTEGEPPPATSVTVLPATGRTPVEPAAMVAATTTFFGHLPQDPRAAWQMTGARIRVKRFDAFTQPWAEVTALALHRIVVDPSTASTRATVRVVRKDGSEAMPEFELTFRRGNSLIIDEIRPV
jgi:hypothetical protein